MTTKSLDSHHRTDRSQDDTKNGGEHGDVDLALQCWAGAITHILHGATEHQCRVNINERISESSTTKRKDEREIRNLDGKGGDDTKNGNRHLIEDGIRSFLGVHLEQAGAKDAILERQPK